MSSGVENAAILMLALGQDEAAEVMKFLEPREVQKLGAAMATMKPVTEESLSEVLDKFVGATTNQTTIGLDSDDYIRSVLTKALGDDKASSLINRILVTRDNTGIESLKWMDAKAVADLIRNEHPQIVATILVHLEAYQASEILSHLSARLRNDVMLRITTLEGVQPAALSELNDVLTRLLTGNDNLRKRAMGGVRTTAEIMNFLGGELEGSVMEGLKAYDPELAQKVLDQMFVFDNIMDIADRDIQAILKEVQSDALILALKGAKEELREKFFKNMSSRAAETMREDLETKGPVKLSEVEKAQREVLVTIRKLADEGTISIGGGGAEDAYV